MGVTSVRRQHAERTRRSGSGQGGAGQRAPGDVIDMPLAVRGASTGFTVLLLGSLAHPLVAAWTPALSQLWLPLVALVAFVVAARRVGRARIPIVHGAVAAMSSYLLMLPLVLLGPAGGDPAQIALTVAASLITGAAVGFLQGSRR
ncbi:hypothetical protein BAY59_34625 [Prauserella coralliicola]|uniref:Uncharacterized protein n=6 Tax=Pseudonocardiaceae TaxID=2070 RepID=A0A2V4AR97_9PSEU|nr:hypothetical protein A4R43_30160 [Amycolatopsis albispora]EHR53552.1 hypothetical protein SacmaDRAFT_5426 [Saccharomonospora marina XMU15]PXY17403.1 hypothetical protein BAY60_34505 [Prauserella muralis]PXY18363.1 hypothetical protein BAY59_34625 [Prauserella coralliicola]PXY25698.1 hypothetical protein BA062_26645 [Prauserella flavalba]